MLKAHYHQNTVFHFIYNLGWISGSHFAICIAGYILASISQTNNDASNTRGQVTVLTASIDNIGFFTIIN